MLLFHQPPPLQSGGQRTSGSGKTIASTTQYGSIKLIVGMLQPQSADVCVCVQVAGCGAPVLLVHGFGVNYMQWRNTIRAVAKDHKVWQLYCIMRTQVAAFQ